MRYLLIIFFLVSGVNNSAQVHKGKIIVENFLAPSIQGNPGGEDANREISVYLPYGYEHSKLHYPVIYFLHGFTVDEIFYLNTFQIEDLLDEAIASGIIRPVIVVFPNSYTSFKGSFYTNSPLTGNWADYIAKDLIQYIDQHYCTIPHRSSRGLCGHSMGGNGSLKIAMLYSNVFSSVYALSPARLDWSEWLDYGSPFYKTVQSAKSIDDLSNDFPALEIADLARTYSPNMKKPPFYIDLPYNYVGDDIVVDSNAYKKWNQNFPANMIKEHVRELKSLTAIKLDWGRNDEFKFVPVACIEFSKKLEMYGINHFAEEYIGDHSSKLGGKEGRIYTELLPFFNTYLKFE